MLDNEFDNDFIWFTGCLECHRKIGIEILHFNLKRKENVMFRGILGEESYTYCPYCGAEDVGFSPYDPEVKIPEVDDEEDSGEPETEDVEYIDDEEVDDDSARVVFACPSCGEKFALDPKNCKKIYCFYCGKVIP